MSNKSRRLYVGITSQLDVRVFKHKNKWYEESFTARYRFNMPIYFEAFSDPSQAIDREKEIKGWRREKKLRLILSTNPDWVDLSAEWTEDEGWKAIPEAEFHPTLGRQPGKSGA